MTEITNENSHNNLPDEQTKDENRQQNGSSLREISYVVLFIGAVFVINAMETGSYRTPWPVAIITALAGLGLFAYSFMAGSRK